MTSNRFDHHNAEQYVREAISALYAAARVKYGEARHERQMAEDVRLKIKAQHVELQRSIREALEEDGYGDTTSSDTTDEAAEIESEFEERIAALQDTLEMHIRVSEKAIRSAHRYEQYAAVLEQ